MLKFLCFGSGSSGNCYYLSSGQDAIIIDAGVGIRSLKKNFIKYGINHKRIKAILITHDHLDHTRSVGSLSRLLDVKVYSSAPVLSKLIISPFSKIDSDQCVSVVEEVSFNIGNLNITPFHIPHDSAENYGYSIVCDDCRFTLMTDMGMLTEIIRKYIKISDFLVLEADYDVDRLNVNPRYDKKLKERIKSGYGHLSNIQTAEILADNYHSELKSVWLCHLSEENNSPELAKNTVKDILSDKGIIADKDFSLNVLNRKIPSGPWLISADEIIEDLELTFDFDY